MLLHYIPMQKTNWIIIVAYSDVFQLKNIDVIEHIVQLFLFLIKVGIM